MDLCEFRPRALLEQMLTANFKLPLKALRHRIFLSLTMVFLFSGCASEPAGNVSSNPNQATSSGPDRQDPISKDQPTNYVTDAERKTTELLLAAPPEQWHQIYQLNEKVIRLADFVPPGETNLDWQTKLSFESHQDLIEFDPIEILLAEAKKSEEKCTFIQHFNLFSGFENDYPTSLRLIMCGENENLKRGELSMLKVIQGEDFLYIIRFLKRIDPFKLNQPDVAKAEIATWSDYLRKIILCNPADDRHPCKPVESN